MRRDDSYCVTAFQGFYLKTIKFDEEYTPGRIFNFSSGDSASIEVVLKSGTQTITRSRRKLLANRSSTAVVFA